MSQDLIAILIVVAMLVVIIASVLQLFTDRRDRENRK